MKILSHSSQEKNGTEVLAKSSKKNSDDDRKIEKDGNGNTRLNPITEIGVHFDYLRIRKEGMLLSEFELLLNYICTNVTQEMDRPWSPGVGATFFPHKLIGTRGVKGGFDVTEEGLYSLMIDMPGEYFEGKSLVDQWNLLVGLHHAYKAIPTRLDIAIDDYSYSLIPVEDMVKACNDGHNFGFRKIGLHSSGMCGQVQRETRYFGSKNSGKFVRVYDHDGECLRFEAELKRDYVRPAFEKIATMERGENYETWEKELQKTMASIALGIIDFRDRGDRRNNMKAGQRDSVRLDFWQKFIDLIAEATFKISLVKPAKTILKNFQWIKRQCSQSLAMMFMGLGGHKFNLLIKEILEIGIDNMDNQKKLWIKDIQKNTRMYC